MISRSVVSKRLRPSKRHRRTMRRVRPSCVRANSASAVPLPNTTVPSNRPSRYEFEPRTRTAPLSGSTKKTCSSRHAVPSAMSPCPTTRSDRPPGSHRQVSYRGVPASSTVVHSPETRCANPRRGSALRVSRASRSVPAQPAIVTRPTATSVAAKHRIIAFHGGRPRAPRRSRA